MKLSKLWMLAAILLCGTALQAQTKRSDDFRAKYTLKEVVVMSRHNIRSPLSSGGAAYQRVTPHQWFKWSSPSSQLSLRGGVLETEMGQFFRQWVVSEGLLPDNYRPEGDEVLFYANSRQRTFATAKYFSAGFLPFANVEITHKLAEDKMWTQHVAQVMIGGKIQNYRNILRRFIRDYGANAEVEDAAQALVSFKRDAFRAADKTQLIGVEGMAANRYFEVLPHLMTQQREAFPFSGRNRRPPKDAVNAMLSLAYTLATNDITAALETVGLDPYVGFLHTLRPGRASLALDMVEELRAYLGDRFVLSLINRRQITPKDFIYQGEKGVMLTDNGRRTFLTAWQNRKKETIVHPFLNEKIPVGLIPHAQAMLLARYMRNDIDDYPVFLIK